MWLVVEIDPLYQKRAKLFDDESTKCKHWPFTGISYKYPPSNLPPLIIHEAIYLYIYHIQETHYHW